MDHTHFLEEFWTFLSESESICENVVYVGDFNYWIDSPNDRKSSDFVELLGSYDLKNYVMEQTHVSGHILDLVISKNRSPLVESLFVEPASTISDHHIVFFQLCYKQANHLENSFRFHDTKNFDSKNFNSFIYESFCMEDLSCPHGEKLFHDVNCLANLYNSKCRSYFEEYAPIVEKIVKVRKNCPWYDAEIRQIKQELRRAEKKLYRLRNESSLDEFRRLRQSKCNLVFSKKREFFRLRIRECSNEPKSLYRILNGLLGKSLEERKLPSYSDHEHLANDFKNFFVNKIARIVSNFQGGSSSTGSLLPDFPLIGFDRFQPVDPSYVLDLMKEVRKTYCGQDPYNVRLVQFDEISDTLAIVFSDIINLSFSKGIFPEDFKKAVVRPLLKDSKDPDKVDSYRPVHNLPYASKLLELACLKQLKQYLNSFDCIPKFQSAYREHHSVETSVLRIYNDLIINKSRGKCSLFVLLDLTAAFDTVDQDILIEDLERIGLDGAVLEWFKSYLTGRKFLVEVSGKYSEVAEMKTGIPQGSVASPILFNIYTMELYYLLIGQGVNCHFYADDTQMLMEVTGSGDVPGKLTGVMNSIECWMNSRKLKLNVGKTELMIVPSHAYFGNLDISGVVLNSTTCNFSESVRSLGIIFDEKLTLKHQINNVKKKAVYNLINIARISKLIDKPSRIKLVHNLVFSQLDFCNSLYYGLPDNTLRPLQLIMNSASRLICGLPRFSRERITPYSISLHFLPIKARIIYKICILVFKALSSGQPKYLRELISEQISQRGLRNQFPGKLIEPIIGTSAYSNRCFMYCAPRIYNSLPRAVCEAENVHIFKKLLKTELFRRAYNLETDSVQREFHL